MSIASEISRLQTAKSAMATAIEGKGVTVPESTKLDGYATLIGQISGGGGGGSALDNLLEEVSHVTPAEDTYTLELPCDMKEGVYILISDPPGNPSSAANVTQNEILSACCFDIRGISTKTNSSRFTIAALKTPTATNAIDWWTPTVTLNADSVSVNFAGGNRLKYLTSFTYYLLRVKGM